MSSLNVCELSLLFLCLYNEVTKHDAQASMDIQLHSEFNDIELRPDKLRDPQINKCRIKINQLSITNRWSVFNILESKLVFSHL